MRYWIVVIYFIRKKYNRQRPGPADDVQLEALNDVYQGTVDLFYSLL